jgi:hypothetical protein
MRRHVATKQVYRTTFAGLSRVGVRRKIVFVINLGTEMYSAKRISTCIIFCVAFFLSPVFTYGQQGNVLAGRWKMISVTPDGAEIPWTLSITYQDGKYSAILGSREGDIPAKDFRVDGQKVHLRAPYEGQEYDIDLKLAGEKLSGTWSGNGDSGETRGEKAASS